MKDFIKENWILITGALAVLGFVVIIIICMSSPGTKLLIEKPLSSLTLGDVLLVAILHAFINRSNNTCTKD